MIGLTYKKIWILPSLAAIGILFYFLNNTTHEPQYFSVADVKIEGVHHINHEVLEHELLPLLSKSIFAVDMDRIKERLLLEPWIANAAVRRIWPNQVWISIIEKTPIARWNDSMLLSSAGELFPADLTQAIDLPAFKGPDGQQMNMLHYYEKIQSALSAVHCKMTYLELTPFSSWSIELNNGIKLHIGNQDVLTRVNYFVKVYSQLAKNNVKNIDYIDLRYTNGFAVHWKQI